MNTDIYRNSLIVKYLSAISRKVSDKIAGCFDAGWAPASIGVLLTAMAAVNILLSLALGGRITLYGWLIRAFLLSTGIFTLYCRTDWQTVKDNSTILRFFNGL